MDDGDLESLPLDAFPEIADFAVTVNDDHLLEYRSASHGLLASFPAWEHADRDLRHFVASDVPLGTIEDPYDDRDEHWRILIFEDDGYIYVLEGDAPEASQFPRFFRVRAERYVQAWAALIDLFNPIKPLDEA